MRLLCGSLHLTRRRNRLPFKASDPTPGEAISGHEASTFRRSLVDAFQGSGGRLCDRPTPMSCLGCLKHVSGFAEIVTGWSFSKI